MTICDKSGIKAVYNYKNKDYVITRGRQLVRVPNPDLWPYKSFMKQNKFFSSLI